MSSTAGQVDCLIVGAGLAGLACARVLQDSGYRPLVLESKSTVGGRVATQVTDDGLVLDEGFQVLLTSYPELKRFVDLSRLDLRYFNSGAMILGGPHDGPTPALLANPIAHPRCLLETLRFPGLTLRDQALVLKLLVASQLARTDTPEAAEEQVTTREDLVGLGFSAAFVESFWEPFLSGVLLERELMAPRSFFRFLIRCFGFGKVALPAKGMAEIPRQMASYLEPGTISLSRQVRQMNWDHVILADGSRLDARAVVCASDPVGQTASEQSRSYRSVVTHYFRSPRLREVSWDRWLVLVPRRYGLRVNHLCVLSNVAPEYGGAKRESVLSATTLGSNVDDPRMIGAEINKIAGRELALEHIKSISVPKALPDFASSRDRGGKQPGVSLRDGVIYCGDLWSSPSINGALRSGRLAAEAVISALD